MAVRSRLGLVLTIVACGPERTDQAELAELCGAAEPVQVLSLRDEEIVPLDTRAWARHGDRWLYSVRELAGPVINVWQGGDPGPIVGMRIESVDRCGGDRRTIADGVDDIFEPRTAGEPWLAYRHDGGDLFWIDPDGAWPARLLGRPRSPWGHLVDGNAVYIHRYVERDFVRFTLGDDGVVTDVLATDVARASGFPGWLDEGPPAAVLVLHDSGELVELTLRSGEVELVQPGVQFFDTSRDLRWVAWAPGDPMHVPPYSSREAWLLDRHSGEQHSLSFEGAPEIFVRVVGAGVYTEARVNGSPVSTRVTLLPGVKSIELEGLWWPSASSEADERVAAIATDGASGSLDTYVFAPEGDALHPVAGPIPGSSWTYSEIWSGDLRPYEDLDLPGDRRPWDAVSFSLSTLQSEVVATRVWSDVELASDRWLVVDGWDPGDDRGELQVIDGDTGEARVVDRDVVACIECLQPRERHHVLPWRTDEVVYQVRDPGTGRTGLWRARFPE